MRKITEFTPDLAGKRIKCLIKGEIIEDAKIQLECGEYSICQNLMDGTGVSSQRRFGYKYSWTCRQGTRDDLCRYNIEVTEIYLLDEFKTITATPISTEIEKKQPIQLININKKQFLKINQDE